MTFQRFWDFITSSAAWNGERGIPHLASEHVQLSLVVVVLAALVSIPPAVVLGHQRRGGLLAVSIVNIGRALPSFGIVALVLPFSLRFGFGLGYWPTFVALALLAIPPIFTNTYTGVREVSPEMVEAAQGMGMRPVEIIRKVELPAALPLVVTGLRVSAVQVVATATLGALVGFPCLGTLIVQGFNDRGGRGKLLAGALAVALLSILTEALFALIERRLTPWVPRRQRGRQRDATIAAPDTAVLPA